MLEAITLQKPANTAHQSGSPTQRAAHQASASIPLGQLTGVAPTEPKLGKQARMKEGRIRSTERKSAAEMN